MLCYVTLAYSLLFPSSVEHIQHTDSIITHVCIVFPISHWIFRTDKLTGSVITACKKRHHAQSHTKEKEEKKNHLHFYGKQNQIQNSIKVWSRQWRRAAHLLWRSDAIAILFMLNLFNTIFGDCSKINVIRNDIVFIFLHLNANAFNLSSLESMIGKATCLWFWENLSSKLSCYARLVHYNSEYLILFTIQFNINETYMVQCTSNRPRQNLLLCVIITRKQKMNLRLLIIIGSCSWRKE